MRDWRGTAGLAAASIAAVLLLALAPAGWDGSGRSGDVLAWSAPQRLSESNMVDFMLQTPLASRIVRTEWEWTLLSVDLSADEAALSRQEIMNDLYVLTERAFRSTTNVQQALIRVVGREADGDPTVLAVLYAKREQWKHPAFGMPERPVQTERWLSETYKLTVDAAAQTRWARG